MDMFLDNYPPFKELHSILANLVCCLYFARFFAHKFVIIISRLAILYHHII